MKTIRRFIHWISDELKVKTVCIGEGANRRVFIIGPFTVREITSLCNGR